MIKINLNVNRNIQFLSGSWRQSQEPNLQAVLYNIFILGPNNLGKLLKFINLENINNQHILYILTFLYIVKFIIYLFSKSLESLILFPRFGIKIL